MYTVIDTTGNHIASHHYSLFDAIEKAFVINKDKTDAINIYINHNDVYIISLCEILSLIQKYCRRI